MATVKIAIKNWPSYVAQLGERAHRAVDRGILSGAHECVQLMQRRTEHAVPASENGAEGAFNTGNYRRRWRVAAIPRGARLYNDAPYSSVIDAGRRAGKRPPAKEIARWARRRLGLDEKEARAAGFLIARAIGKRGLRPRRVMSGALDEMTRIVVRAAERELQLELMR